MNMPAHSDNDRYWYALYTRPKFEKKVNAALEEKRIRSILPLRTSERIWSDRRKMISEPLFPSYVFVFANLAERYLSLQSNGVVRMVGFNGQPARIPQAQIESVYRIMQLGYEPEPHHYLRSGDLVEIVAGPLQGTKGFFVEERGTGRLVVSIDAIQQSVAIIVRRDQVRKKAAAG